MPKILSLFMFMITFLCLFAGQALAELGAEATAAQTAIEGLITDMSGMGWVIATAMVVASGGIGLFLKFTRRGGIR